MEATPYLENETQAQKQEDRLKRQVSTLYVCVYVYVSFVGLFYLPYLCVFVSI